MSYTIQVIKTNIGPGMPLTRPSWVTLNPDIETRQKADLLLSLQRKLTPRAEFRIVDSSTPDLLPA